MKRKLIPILLSAALLAAPGFYSLGQEVCKVEPDQTLRLYPEGQNIDKGLEGALGPLESNGFTREETVDQWGSLTYIGDNARVDLYFPENPNGQMVVVCPGGGYWHVSSFNEGTYVAEWMLERGVSVAVVKYRLPNGHWEIPLRDVQNVFRYCRANAADWGMDQIGVMGFSAGGHLAASATNLYTDSTTRPDFSILIYPVITMDKALTHNGTRTCLIGEESTAGLEHRYSIENQVTENTPTSFLVHCTDDRTVPVENSIMYYESLLQHKVPVEMHIYPSGGHGWGFSSEKYKGKGKDNFSYARPEFEASLERWLEGIRTK